jgi:hypothetical protein
MTVGRIGAGTPGFLWFSRAIALGCAGTSCSWQLLDFQREMRIHERGASIHIQDLSGDPARFRRAKQCNGISEVGRHAEFPHGSPAALVPAANGVLHRFRQSIQPE